MQKEIAGPDADYRWTQMALTCDYKMLHYLIKDSGMNYAVGLISYSATALVWPSASRESVEAVRTRTAVLLG